MPVTFSFSGFLYLVSCLVTWDGLFACEIALASWHADCTRPMTHIRRVKMSGWLPRKHQLYIALWKLVNLWTNFCAFLFCFSVIVGIFSVVLCCVYCFCLMYMSWSLVFIYFILWSRVLAIDYAFYWSAFWRSIATHETVNIYVQLAVVGGIVAYVVKHRIHDQ